MLLRPDVALDLARSEVARLKKRGLLGGRDVQFDPITDFYLLAWSDFQAREFPSGEALKLAIATGLELDDLIRRNKILGSSAGFVEILSPPQRRANGSLEPGLPTFVNLLDAAQALMLTYDEEGEQASRAFLGAHQLSDDPRLRDVIQAMLHAVPSVKAKGEYVAAEARVLEALRLTLFPDLAPPANADAEPSQLDLGLVSEQEEALIPG